MGPLRTTFGCRLASVFFNSYIIIAFKTGLMYNFFTAFYSYDGKCRILSSTTWDRLLDLEHPMDTPIDPSVGLFPSIGQLWSLGNHENIAKSHSSKGSQRLAIYSEQSGLGGANGYVAMLSPFTFNRHAPDPAKPNPKVSGLLNCWACTHIITSSILYGGDIWSSK